MHEDGGVQDSGRSVHVGFPDPTHWDPLVGRKHGTGLQVALLFSKGSEAGPWPALLWRTSRRGLTTAVDSSADLDWLVRSTEDVFVFRGHTDICAFGTEVITF
jgi:hypothetical protein